MDVTITDAMEKFIEEQIGSGTYADASDVVREAIRRMMETSQGSAAPKKPTGPIATFRRPLVELEVVLTAEMDAYMTEGIDRGLYVDKSEVVRDALRLVITDAPPATSKPTGPISTE